MMRYMILLLSGLLGSTQLWAAANCLHSNSWQCQQHHSQSGQGSQTNGGLSSGGHTPDPATTNPHLGSTGGNNQNPVAVVPAKVATPPTAVPPLTPTAVPPKQPTPVPQKQPIAVPGKVPQPMAIPQQQPTAVPPQNPVAVPGQVPQVAAVPSKQPVAVPPKQPIAVPAQVPQPMTIPPQPPTVVPPQQPIAVPGQVPQIVAVPHKQPIAVPPKQPVAIPGQVPQPMSIPPKQPIAVPPQQPVAVPGKVPQVVALPSKQPMAVPQKKPVAVPGQVPQVVAVPPMQPTALPYRQPIAVPGKVPQQTVEPPRQVVVAPHPSHVHFPLTSQLTTAPSITGAAVSQVGPRPVQLTHKPTTAPIVPQVVGVVGKTTPLVQPGKQPTIASTHFLLPTGERQVPYQTPGAAIWVNEIVEPGIQNGEVELYRSNDAEERLYKDVIPMDKAGFHLTVVGIRPPDYGMAR